MATRTAAASKKEEKFEQCFHWLIGNEGRYSNDPNDPGGETMWGITKAVAKQAGYIKPMQEMPIDTAKQIYRALYWMPWMECAAMPLAFELFDCAVNCGPATAANLLQRALGVVQDGDIGPKTMAAASAISPTRLWILYVATVMEYRTRLSGWKTYATGWTNRSISNMRRGASIL